MRTRRADLRTLQEERLGAVPAEVPARLETTTDAERRCVRQVLRIRSPEELDL